METSAYKELSYRMQGFRAVTVLVAVVTVVLCLVVGIGCWVLVTGVREDENIHDIKTSEKIEVEIVEGEVHEPLRLKEAKAPANKAGRVVQHIAEIDFQHGSHEAAEAQEPRAAPAAPEAQEPRATPAAPEARQYQVPQMIDGVMGVRIQPPQVNEAHTNYMRRVEVPEARYMRNELSAAQPAVVVVQPQSQVAPNSLIEHLYNFTQDIASDIEERGLFEALANRASEQYMRNTMQWLGDYTTHLMSNEDLAAHVRSRRSILVPLATQALIYTNYATFGNFMFKELNAIAEYNLQGRKLSGDPAAEFLDSTFWSSDSHKDTDRKEVLTAATDDWEPQVNKVSIEFIGEILNTLLNMMREYLMKDHVMECLWYMFCEDLNHQAKYADIYGFLARVNR